MSIRITRPSVIRVCVCVGGGGVGGGGWGGGGINPWTPITIAADNIFLQQLS